MKIFGHEMTSEEAKAKFFACEYDVLKKKINFQKNNISDILIKELR